VFRTLGSNLNPVLTQLAKTRRVLFVEGNDFQIISRFARKLGLRRVANRSDFAVVPVEGFNPVKVRDFKQGMETTLGASVSAGVVFDRDFRSDVECQKEAVALKKTCGFVHIHGRKELENFVLLPDSLGRAIGRRIAERNARSGESGSPPCDMAALLGSVTEPMRHRVAAQYINRRRRFEKARQPSLDDASIDEQVMREFDELWADPQRRLMLAPGKEVLAALNAKLQGEFKITVSPALIIECCLVSEVPQEMIDLVNGLANFSEAVVGDSVGGA